MLSIILPTRNRPHALLRQVRRLCASPLRDAKQIELIVLDRGSMERPILGEQVTRGWSMRHEVVQEASVAGALSKLERIVDPRSRWCLILDDCTTPIVDSPDQLLQDLDDWEGDDVGVVAADVYDWFPGAQPVRGRGGLPEVVRAGAYAIRRDALGCYAGVSERWQGFAHELDLSASVMRAGLRTVFDARVLAVRRVQDRRQEARNLGRWLMDRLEFVHARAPREVRADALGMMLRVALRRAGRWVDDGEFASWRADVQQRLEQQPAPDAPALSHEHWERLIGLACARDAVFAQVRQGRTRMGIIEEGDDVPLLQRAIVEGGGTLVCADQRPEVLMLGTLEPGMILDAMLRLGETKRGARVVAPWVPTLPGGIVDAFWEPGGHGAGVSGSRRAA